MSWKLRWTVLLCAVASLSACLDKHELSLGSHMPPKDASASTSAPDAGSQDLRESDDDDDVHTEVDDEGDFEHEMR